MLQNCGSSVVKTNALLLGISGRSRAQYLHSRLQFAGQRPQFFKEEFSLTYGDPAIKKSHFEVNIVYAIDMISRYLFKGPGMPGFLFSLCNAINLGPPNFRAAGAFGTSERLPDARRFSTIPLQLRPSCWDVTTANNPSTDTLDRRPALGTQSARRARQAPAKVFFISMAYATILRLDAG
jgi:hypothetical protein